jgi:hypothetical protein
MSNISKIAKKVLMSQSFFEDGYEYQFVSVEEDEEFDGAFNLTINVILPKKGQSYCTLVFSNHIHQILDNLWGYIGSSFSYSENILVDGEEPTENGVYISPEKQSMVLSSIRKKFKRAQIKTKENYLSFDIFWNKDDRDFYELNDVYIDFNFLIQLSNFEINGKRVTPSLKLSDEIAGVISDELYDNDSFRSNIDDTLYTVLLDEINTHNIDDLYVQGRWLITKIDGWEVFPKGWVVDITDEMFT